MGESQDTKGQYNTYTYVARLILHNKYSEIKCLGKFWTLTNQTMNGKDKINLIPHAKQPSKW